MSDERAVHVGVPIIDLADPSPASVSIECPTCGCRMWVDTMSCSEIVALHGEHDHRCVDCVLDEAAVDGVEIDVQATAGSIARAAAWHRRN